MTDKCPLDKNVASPRISSLTVILLLPSILHAYAKELAVNHSRNAQDSVDDLADKLVDHFVDKLVDWSQSLKPLPFHHRDIDDSTLGKLNGLGTRARASHRHPLQIRSLPQTIAGIAASPWAPQLPPFKVASGRQILPGISVRAQDKNKDLLDDLDAILGPETTRPPPKIVRSNATTVTSPPSADSGLKVPTVNFDFGSGGAGGSSGGGGGGDEPAWRRTLRQGTSNLVLAYQIILASRIVFESLRGTPLQETTEIPLIFAAVVTNPYLSFFQILGPFSFIAAFAVLGIVRSQLEQEP